jgi:hypothetical protein
MVQVHKDVGSRSFIDIPLDAHFLNITIWAVDHSGNMAYLNHTMVVKDGIPPSILEIVSFQKDRKIFFMVRADDNKGTSDMTCQLVSTNISENMTFFSDGEKFHLDIPLVEGVANFSYKIKLTDRSGNSVISDMRWLELAIDSPSNGTEKVNYFILFIIIMVSLPLVASVLAMFISRIVRKDRNPNIEKNGLKGP